MLIPPRIRRGRAQPPGHGVVRPSFVPRGMRLAVDFQRPSFANLIPIKSGGASGNGDGTASVFPVNRGSVVKQAMSVIGTGAQFKAGTSGGTNNVSYRINKAALCSIEVLMVTGAGSQVNQTFAGFNQASDGSSGTNDSNFSSDGSGNVNFYAYDGAAHLTPGYGLSANTAYHLVGVADGTNIYLYINGSLFSSTTCGSTFTGYTQSHLLVGAFTGGSGTGTCGANILFAGYHDLPLTSAEVTERYFNTFGFLTYETDEMFEFLVGGSAPPTFQAAWAMRSNIAFTGSPQ